MLHHPLSLHREEAPKLDSNSESEYPYTIGSNDSTSDIPESSHPPCITLTTDSKGYTELHTFAQYASKEKFISLLSLLTDEALEDAALVRTWEGKSLLGLVAEYQSYEAFAAFLKIVNKKTLANAYGYRTIDLDTIFRYQSPENCAAFLKRLTFNDFTSMSTRACEDGTLPISMVTLKKITEYMLHEPSWQDKELTQLLFDTFKYSLNPIFQHVLQQKVTVPDHIKPHLKPIESDEKNISDEKEDPRHQEMSRHIKDFRIVIKMVRENHIDADGKERKDYDITIAQLKNPKIRPQIRAPWPDDHYAACTHKLDLSTMTIIDNYIHHVEPKEKNKHKEQHHTKKLSTTLLSPDLNNGIYGESEPEASHHVGLMFLAPKDEEKPGNKSYVIIKSRCTKDIGTYHRNYIGTHASVERYKKKHKRFYYTNSSEFKKQIKSDPTPTNEMLAKLSKESLKGIIIAHDGIEARQIAQRRAEDLKKELSLLDSPPIYILDKYLRRIRPYSETKTPPPFPWNTLLSGISNSMKYRVAEKREEEVKAQQAILDAKEKEEKRLAIIYANCPKVQAATKKYESAKLDNEIAQLEYKEAAAKSEKAEGNARASKWNAILLRERATESAKEAQALQNKIAHRKASTFFQQTGIKKTNSHLDNSNDNKQHSKTRAPL